MKPLIKKTYYSTGYILNEQHFLNDKLHRENGPALIWYYENGNILYEYYFINGKLLTKSQYLIYQRKRKLNSLCK